MNMKVFATITIALVLCVTPVAKGEWHCDRGDIQRTGVSEDIIKPPLMISTDDEGDKFNLDLSGDEGDITVCSAVVSDGVLVVGTRGGKLYAINIYDFKHTLWDKSEPNSEDEEIYRDSACIDGDRVYVGDMMGRIRCFDLYDGNLVWGEQDNNNYDDWITTSPIITMDNKLMFGTNKGFVYSLIKETGEMYRKGKSKQLIGPVKGILCDGVNRDRIYVGCGGNKKEDYYANLYCINSINLEEERWSHPKKAIGTIPSTPSIKGDSIYVISSGNAEDDDGKGKPVSYLSRFSLDDVTRTELLISDKFQKDIYTAPAVTDDHVIVSWGDGFIRSFDIDNFDNYTSVPIFGNGSGVVSGDYYYVGDLNGNIYAVDYKSGTISQGIKVSSAMSHVEPYVKIPASSIIISNGFLFYINTFCELIRLEPAPIGRLTIEETSVQTTPVDPFSFTFTLENTRSTDETSYIDLELQLEYEINGEWHELDYMTLKPGESQQVELGGMGSQFDGKDIYEVDVRFKVLNAHQMEVVWGDQKKTWIDHENNSSTDITEEDSRPLDGLKLKLNVEDPLPCIEVENSIDIDSVWDDEIARDIYEFEVINPCPGTLNLKAESSGGIIMIDEGLTVFPDSKGTLRFRLDDSVLSDPGTYRVMITLKTEKIDDVKTTVRFEILRSLSVVVVKIGSTDAMVNGEEFTLDAPPYITEGTTMVPLRFVSEGLGFDKPEWIADIRTIIIHLGGERYLRLVLGHSKAIIEESDGSITEQDLAVAPEIKNGRTFIPLRFIGEIVGAGVNWNGETKEVTLTRSLKT
jgi:outer membrane protein assembly factor BamB